MELKYRPEIDGLRAIAVLSVIIYHAEFVFGSAHFLKGGFLGVDVFFVISGFLITSLIISEHQRTGGVSLINFYERRARRILPALLIVMLFSLPFAWNYLLPSQLIDFSKSLIASLLFSSNFYWYETLQEYGAESALLKPFLHTWSLAIEEQYYIIFPVIFIAIFRWFKNYTVAILMVGFLVSLQLAELVAVKHASFSFYMLHSRFWELIAGSLVSNILYFYPQKDNEFLYKRFMPLIGLVLIFVSVVFVEFGSNHPGYITLMPVFGTVLILWFANEKELVTRILASRWLVRVGLISYSLYLWHYPIFAFGRIKNLNTSIYDKFEWIILTFALSVATFFLIERPFRSKKIITFKTMLNLLLFSMVIIGGYSFYVIKNNGVQDRFPKLLEVFGKNEFDNKFLQAASWNVLNDLAKSEEMDSSNPSEPSVFEAKHLWFSGNSATKKILIVGNSHSKDLFNSLYLNKDIFSYLEFARFGMNNSLLPDQLELLYESPNFIASDIIVISFRYRDETVKGIYALIDAIKNKSKMVKLVLNTTEFNDIGGKPIFDKYIEGRSHNFSIRELKEMFFNNRSHDKDEINSSLGDVSRNKHIEFLDKNDFICNLKSRTCDGITDDGYKSFYDYGHFTLEGARFFGRRIHETGWLKID